MKGANPGQGKKLTGSPGGTKIKQYKSSHLNPGVKTEGGTKGGDGRKPDKGYDK